MKSEQGRNETGARADAPGAQHDVLIFVHVPKTGGLTLDHLIRRQYSHEAVRWISYDRPEQVSEFRALNRQQRSQIRCLTGHVPFGVHRELPGNPVYVTMLRDPVARFVSEFGQVLRVPRAGAWRPPQEQLHSFSLEDFLDYRIETNAMDVQTRFLGGYIPPVGTQPPFDPLPDDALERAKENLRQHFLVVGLTERFDESVLLMKKRLGWNRHLFYARKNAAPKKFSSGSGVAPETLERIAAHTQLDAELVRFGGELLESAILSEGKEFQKELRQLHRVNRTIFALRNVWQRSPSWLHKAPGSRQIRALGHYLLR